MKETGCQLCHDGRGNGRELVNVETGDRAVLCPTCLRTNARAKASRSDERACQRLAEMAGEPEEVWGTKHVLYLVRAIDVPDVREELPATPPPRAREN